MKQEAFFNEFASFRIANFEEKGGTDNNTLSKRIDRIAALKSLELPSNRRDRSQKSILGSVFRGTQWGLHVQKGRNNTGTYQSIGTNCLHP